MNSIQDILNILLVIVLLIFIFGFLFVTYYVIQILKAIRHFADSLETTHQNFINKLQMKALAALPALLIAIISRIFKKRG